jgi:hypothetical protein
MGISRWFKGNNDNDESGQHEEETLVTLNTPENFLVFMEGEAQDEDGNMSIVELPLTVPFGSLNHITYVLALNGVPHRVEPLG